MARCLAGKLLFLRPGIVTLALTSSPTSNWLPCFWGLVHSGTTRQVFNVFAKFESCRNPACHNPSEKIQTSIWWTWENTNTKDVVVMLRKRLRSFRNSSVDRQCACWRLTNKLNIKCVGEGQDSEGEAALSSPRSTFHYCSSLTSHTNTIHSLTVFTFISVSPFLWTRNCVFSPVWHILVTVSTNTNTVGFVFFVYFFSPLDLIATEIKQKSNGIAMQPGAVRNIRGRRIDEKLHLVDCWSAEKQNTAKVNQTRSREACECVVSVSQQGGHCVTLPAAQLVLTSPPSLSSALTAGHA